MKRVHKLSAVKQITKSYVAFHNSASSSVA